MIKYIVLYYYCSMFISLLDICFHFNTTNFLRNKLFRNRLLQNESFYRWLCPSNRIILPLHSTNQSAPNISILSTFTANATKQVV